MIEFKISSFCNWGNCVEVGVAPDGSVVVRASREADQATALVFTRDEWTEFLKGAKAGEFDLL
jgi:hypothetical protein